MKHKNVAFFIPHLGCPYRCSFCDQKAISGNISAPSVEEVQRTLADAKSHIADRSNTEIAFFGGSFTALPEDTMRKYLEAAKPFLGKDGFAGIRISTRPDAVSSGLLSWLKQYGVSAVEFGAQSMKNDVLKRNGRGHTAEDVEHASHLVKMENLQRSI